VTAFTLTLLMIGCEENITAVTGTDRAFSFYGVLRPEADTQYISIYPISDVLAPTEPEPLDATITAVNQSTGETYELRDSVVREPNGDFAHFAWMPIRANYDHTYNIRAENREHQVSTVTVTVPPEASLEIREPEERFSAGIINPVFVDGDVPRLMKVEVEYHIKFNEGEPEVTTARVPVSYREKARKVDGGWIIDINLSDDFEILRGRLRAQGDWSVSYGIALLDMTVRMAVVNEEWNPPGGDFDDDVLVQPGTMSNVENGFGFVGAGFRLNETWRPAEEYLEMAGWSSL
jgi:hypothetical protein